MRCFEFDLNTIPKVVLIGKQIFTCNDTHVTRINPEYILYVITSGTLHLENAGEELHLQPGDVYLFRKGDFQKPLKNTSCEYYYVHFNNEPTAETHITEEEYNTLIRSKGNDFKAYIQQKDHINSKEILLQIQNLLKAHRLSFQTDPESRIKGAYAFVSLLFKMEGMHLHPYQCEKSFSTINKISEYIEQNYSQDISSHDIETLFSINYDYANRLFKKIKGSSIMAYKNTVRICAAKEKITVSAKPLWLIAQEVGYEDNCYFSKCFKKYEGISPQEYRERILKNETI